MSKFAKAIVIAKQIGNQLEQHPELVELAKKKVIKELSGGKHHMSKKSKSPKKMSGGKRKSPKRKSPKRKSPKRKSPKKMSIGRKQSGGLKRRSYFYQRTRQLHGEQGPVIAKCPRGKKMAKNGRCFKKRKSISPKKK
jgi:penicillin-insensitive murein endopeptidase